MSVHANAGWVVWARCKMGVFVEAHCGVVKILLKECFLEMSSFFCERWPIGLSRMVQLVGNSC